jgi:hypothetical protein
MTDGQREGKPPSRGSRRAGTAAKRRAMPFDNILDTAADADASTILWWLAGALLLLAAAAVWAEHRRGKRRNLDSVGWMPWNLIQILAFLGAVAAAALALKT